MADSAQLARACEELAASPLDKTKPADVAGVTVSNIDAAKAIPACRAAVAALPNDPGLLVALARALDATRTADAEALKLYRQAADAGHLLAMNNLASMYEEGRGTAKDGATAAAWYRKAADGGFVRAEVSLANLLWDGIVVPKDIPGAVDLYRKAADAGDGDGMAALAFAYETGQGVGKDPLAALRLYRSAAALGNADGMNGMAGFMEAGTIVQKDEAGAVDWYKRAALAGSQSAKINLSTLMLRGRGTPLDEAGAIALFRDALNDRNYLEDIAADRARFFAEDTRIDMKTMLSKDGVYIGPIDSSIFSDAVVLALRSFAAK